MTDSPVEVVASVPLLETRLYAPRWRAGLVSRPRLTERLRQAVERKLTLVSAPTGFGKTTLLAEWLASARAGTGATGWVSLDRSASDPMSFWAHVVRALQKVRPGVGARALSLLQLLQPPAIESVLTTLINEIDEIDFDFSLVLDDYHSVEDESVHDAVAFLLDHLPPRMHLVVVTRSDPPLPLARLRARRELTELRAADLRFTAAEASEFLNQVMDLQLSPADVAALESRTEGWIAGLQLAALSMQGRDDVHGFIAAFSGDHRHIADYLVEEVLRSQPEHVRSFLLKTSILDRLSGPLCDAVTGGTGGRALLGALERSNLFVVPLDDTREWYRFHHLFADVLQAQLREEQPDEVAALHRCASRWYERNGSTADAVGHALAGGDPEAAATLVERAWPEMDRSLQSATWRGWAEMLPDELVRVRPVLSVGYAWALLDAGELERADARLREVELWLDNGGEGGARSKDRPAGVVVDDEAQFRALPATIANARAYHAQALGDSAGSARYARRALELLPEGDSVGRASASLLLGIAYWANGDLNAAYRTFAVSMERLRNAGLTPMAIGGAFVMVDIRVAQGLLRDALSACEQALRLAAEQDPPAVPGTADLYVRLGELYREWGELQTAAQHLRTSRELGEAATFLGTRYRWYAAMAQVQVARGELDSALGLLDEAERAHSRDPLPDVRPVGALKARLRIVQGKPAEAVAWLEEQGVSVDDEPSFRREFEHLTLAWALVARYDADRREPCVRAAMELLDRLLQAAERGRRAGSVIETLLLQSLAHQALKEMPPALEALQRALALAEPEGYLQTFVDHGDAMRELLRYAVARGIAGAYGRRVLAAFEAPARAAASPEQPVAAATRHGLTARELEILRLVAAGMRNQAIASHLFISPSTVKRHIANAYGKLGVGHRTEAVVRANQLGLL